jgi:predicted enzyme related to lactoylglutathione lyase
MRRDGGASRRLTHPQLGVPMGNPVTHFEVLGQDAPALQNFYGQVFGWEMQDMMDGAYYIGLVKG